MNMFEADADYVLYMLKEMDWEIEDTVYKHELNTYDLRKDVCDGIRARYAEKIAERFYRMGAISPRDLDDMHDTMEAF
jgi:hypothetical protein